MAQERELVIDRNVWLRGEGSHQSCLYRPRDGKMCCVGIYLDACGVPKDRMVAHSNATSLAEKLPDEAKWLFGTSPLGGTFASADANYLYAVNDTEAGSKPIAHPPPVTVPDEAFREAEIVRYFAAHHVRVTFIN